jgi:pyridoxal phosphate enzyme (YggS family)
LQSISSAITNNVRRVRAQIAEAASACGRDPSEIRLVAVSKRKPTELIRAAFAAGITDFGENYLQEAVEKTESLRDIDVTWHFIGAIQSNKTRSIAQHFHWVHTVASEKIARRLSEQCPPDRTLNVCLQVNVDQDPNKAGVSPEHAGKLLASALAMPRLRLRGLMTILQQDTDPAAGYRHLAELWTALKASAGPHWDSLSMGMSGDFEAAIAAGATHVRIGTAIFGARD